MRKREELTLNEKIEKREELKFKSIKVYEVARKAKVSMSAQTLERVENCGTFLQFLADQGLENVKLGVANFCGNRFCPHCSANKARKDALEFAILLEWIEQHYGYRFIFLTLTAPNIPAHEVEDELRDYSKSFKRLFERKPVKAICKGYIRKLEMTYNIERDDFHPHYHILFAVNKSYFTDKNYYLSQEKWLNMWKSCKRNDEINQVNVKAVTRSSISGAVEEMAKYIAKESNYSYNEEVFKTFYMTLKGKRYLSFKGVFDETHKKYEAGELDYLKEDEDIEYVYKLIYKWQNGKYKQAEKIELTDSEKEKYNLKASDQKARKKQYEDNKVKNLAVLNKLQRQKTDKILKFRKAGGSLQTGEIEFAKGEKNKIEKQIEFEKIVDKFNDKHRN